MRQQARGQNMQIRTCDVRSFADLRSHYGRRDGFTKGRKVLRRRRAWFGKLHKYIIHGRYFDAPFPKR